MSSFFRKKLKEQSNLHGLTKNHDNKQISMKINKGSADFMNYSGLLFRNNNKERVKKG